MQEYKITLEQIEDIVKTLGMTIEQESWYDEEGVPGIAIYNKNEDRVISFIGEKHDNSFLYDLIRESLSTIDDFLLSK